MGLLAPWFLAGLGALALPVYLHLLRQHKTTPVPFSSLRLFERRTQSSIKHRRLRHLLLLLMRLLLLALIVLAFAQPFVQREVKISPSEKRLLAVVDQSFSMRAGTRLADAKRQAAELLGKRAPNQAAQVATLGNQLKMLTEPATDAGTLRGAVETVQASDERSAYGELSRAVRMAVTNDPRPMEVHLFTDNQKSALPAGYADLALPNGVTLTVHRVVSKPEPNWAVETVSAPGMLWDTKKARVQAIIAGYETPAAKRTVSLVVGEAIAASKTVDVPANGRATVEFQGLEVPYGFSRCRIRIDSADTLAADDHAYFAVQRSDPKRVLLVHDSRDTRSPLYFRSAMAAAAEAAFALDTVSSDQAGGADPARFAFVVISDARSLPASFLEKAQRYVSGGGSILVAAGPNIAQQGKVPVLDVAVSEGKYYSRSGERFSIVGQADFTHPSLRRAARWEGVKFFYAVAVDPSGSRVVARLSDQTPLLLERRIGEGRALLFASTFDNVANDFPLQPSFVAFVDQSSRYLSSMEERSATMQVSGHVELRSAKEQAVSVEVIDPEGKRPLSLRESTTAQSYQVPREGFFEVRRANGRHEMVAVNADRRESDLALIPEETIALWTGSPGAAPSVESKPASDGTAGRVETHAFEPEKKPHSFWWYFLLAAAVAALAESALAGRYLGVQQE